MSRTSAQRRLIDELLSFFGGRTQPVVAHLIDSGKLTLEDVKEAEQTLQAGEENGLAREAATRRGSELRASSASLRPRAALSRPSVAIDTRGGVGGAADARSATQPGAGAILALAAASAKFLVPFAALVALGSQFSWLAPATVPRMEMAVMVDTSGVPFYRPALPYRAASTTVPESRPLSRRDIRVVAIGIWISRSRPDSSELGRALAPRREQLCVGALPVEDGRVLETLRRLERCCGHRTPIALVSSDTSLEPGVFGLLRPVLLWPRRLERTPDRRAGRGDSRAPARRTSAAATISLQPLTWSRRRSSGSTRWSGGSGGA